MSVETFYVLCTPQKSLTCTRAADDYGNPWPLTVHEQLTTTATPDLWPRTSSWRLRLPLTFDLDAREQLITLIWTFDLWHHQFFQTTPTFLFVSKCCNLIGRENATSFFAAHLQIERSGVRALVGDIVLCSWAKHFTLTVPLSSQVYKWVPANWMLGVTLRWTSIPSRGK